MSTIVTGSPAVDLLPHFIGGKWIASSAMERLDVTNPATGELLARLKKNFAQVKHVKPPASRAESVELYLVATGFRK